MVSEAWQIALYAQPDNKDFNGKCRVGLTEKQMPLPIFSFALRDLWKEMHRRKCRRF